MHTFLSLILNIITNNDECQYKYILSNNSNIIKDKGDNEEEEEEEEKDTDDDKERGIRRLPIRIMNTKILQTQRVGYKYITNTKRRRRITNSNTNTYTKI
mmetsp:Transcript_58249/g.62940  ORF Transcript_58249/g.62940 Transcript_58249/m.62940 type:complete len:100 (-) Transcript_58249:54-353(-)